MPYVNIKITNEGVTDKQKKLGNWWRTGDRIA